MNHKRFDYPPVIREIANGLEMYHYQHTVSWAEMAQRVHDGYFQEFLFRKAADAIAHEFAGKVLEHTYIQRYEHPEGQVLRLDAVALTYRELLEVLYRAYAEGQTDGMKRRYDFGSATQVMEKGA